MAFGTWKSPHQKYPSFNLLLIVRISCFVYKFLTKISGILHKTHLQILKEAHYTVSLAAAAEGIPNVVFSTMNLKIFPRKPKAGVDVVVAVIVVVSSSSKISSSMLSRASSSNSSMAVSTVHLDLQNSSFLVL